MRRQGTWGDYLILGIIALGFVLGCLRDPSKVNQASDNYDGW